MEKKPVKMIRIVFRAVPILLLLGITFVLFDGILAWLWDKPFDDPKTILIASLCWVVAWFFIVIFHFKKETIMLPIPQAADFLNRAMAQLEELGYEIILSSRDKLISRPSFHSFLFGGGILITVEGQVAYITGPKYYVERLRNRLRLTSHMAKVWKTFSDSQLRKMDNRLKQVQILMRLKPEEWANIYPEVLEPLLNEKAEVTCTVNITAQSDIGVMESTIEMGIREILKQRNIKAEILKEPWKAGGGGPKNAETKN